MPEGPNSIPLPGEPKHFYGFKAALLPSTFHPAWAPKLQILVSSAITFTSTPSPFPSLHTHCQLTPIYTLGSLSLLRALSPTSALDDADLDDWEVDGHVLQDTDIPDQGPERMNVRHFGDPLSSGTAGVSLELLLPTWARSYRLDHVPPPTPGQFTHSSMLTSLSFFRLSPSPP